LDRSALYYTHSLEYPQSFSTESSLAKKNKYVVIVLVHSHVDCVTYPRGKRILPDDFFAKEVKIRLSREGTRVNTKMLPFFSPLSDRGLSSAVAVDPNCAVMICISDFINSLSCDTLGGEKREDGKGSEYCHLYRNRDFETGCFESDEEEE